MGTLFSCLRVLVGGDLKTLVLQAKSVAMSGCCKGGRRESLENWPKESFKMHRGTLVAYLLFT